MYYNPFDEGSGRRMLKELWRTVLASRVYSDCSKTSEAAGRTLCSACPYEGGCVSRDGNLQLIIFRSFAFFVWIAGVIMVVHGTRYGRGLYRVPHSGG